MDKVTTLKTGGQSYICVDDENGQITMAYGDENRSVTLLEYAPNCFRVKVVLNGKGMVEIGDVSIVDTMTTTDYINSKVDPFFEKGGDEDGSVYIK